MAVLFKMDSREKPYSVYNILSKDYADMIREISLHKDRPFLKAISKNEIIIYIRYNDYEEYTYCVIFSPIPDDQMRINNYDDKWDVKPRLHHFHIRGMQSVKESPMKGDPHNDIPILVKKVIEYIKK